MQTTAITRSAKLGTNVVKPFTWLTLAILGLLATSCQQTPSVAEVTAACKRGSAEIATVEFGEAFTSTEPERVSGVPPHVTVYPVKVTYRFPPRPGLDPQSTVSRNVYINTFGELVCD